MSSDHFDIDHYPSRPEKAKPVKPGKVRTAADILQEMSETFRLRNADYRDNYKMVPKIMAILFPNGMPPGLPFQEHFHLFELIIVKLTRFANTELQHQDSIHDVAIYAAMIEAILKEQG